MPAVTRASTAQPAVTAAPAQYSPLPPHSVGKEGEAYLATRTPEERELHELAVKMLGSSYFVERTHGFRKWAAANAAAVKKT